MGVTLWYSRCELPGAAVSPEFSFGANLEGGAEPTSHLPKSQDGDDSGTVIPKSAADILNALSSKEDSANAGSILSEASLDNKNVAQSAPLNVDSVVSKASAEFVADLKSNEAPSATVPAGSGFNNTPSLVNIDALDLMFWVGQKSWFLSDNDSEYPEQLKRQLLLNMASSLGESVESAQVMCFRWPFFGNQRLPGNDSESMLELLRYWLGERLVADGLTGFLMGEKVANLLLQTSLSGHAGEAFELNVSDDRDVKVVTTLSLNELLREPLKKRIAWQHLSSCKTK